MYKCTYVYMYVCMHVRIYFCLYVCMYISASCIHTCMDGWMDLCIYEWVNGRMEGSMYTNTYKHLPVIIQFNLSKEVNPDFNLNPLKWIYFQKAFSVFTNFFFEFWAKTFSITLKRSSPWSHLTDEPWTRVRIILLFIFAAHNLCWW